MTSACHFSASERAASLFERPLQLSAARAARLYRAAREVDASIWRGEMERMIAAGFTPRHPDWERVSASKMIPWLECAARLVVAGHLSFRDVIALRQSELRLSERETRLAAFGPCVLTGEADREEANESSLGQAAAASSPCLVRRESHISLPPQCFQRFGPRRVAQRTRAFSRFPPPLRAT